MVAVFGQLAWWWMAHAFRERVPVYAGSGASAGADSGGAPEHP